MLLYIHGFNSSNQSDKAVKTAQYIQQNYPNLTFHQPQIPTSIHDAMALLTALTERAVAEGEPVRFIGSSLGGYFASFLAEK